MNKEFQTKNKLQPSSSYTCTAGAPHTSATVPIEKVRQVSSRKSATEATSTASKRQKIKERIKSKLTLISCKICHDKYNENTNNEKNPKGIWIG